MKRRIGFVSNSSSTSFTLISKEPVEIDVIMSKMTQAPKGDYAYDLLRQVVSSCLHDTTYDYMNNVQIREEDFKMNKTIKSWEDLYEELKNELDDANIDEIIQMIKEGYYINSIQQEFDCHECGECHLIYALKMDMGSLGEYLPEGISFTDQLYLKDYMSR